MSPPHNRSPLALEARKRQRRGVRELAEAREEREREQKQADAEQIGQAMHERNAVRLGRGELDTREGA